MRQLRQFAMGWRSVCQIFFAIFKLYYPASGIFFTLVGELGLLLHEIWEISNLSVGSIRYEEYFPCTIELEQMEKDNPELFETYWELMCHFYICMDVHNAWGNTNGIKVWADYLFPVLDNTPEEVQFPISDDNIIQMMASSGHEEIILDEDDVR